MANVAIPLDKCGVGLDDFERVCACGSGHGDSVGEWLGWSDEMVDVAS
jgi:hypothetical protein